MDRMLKVFIIAGEPSGDKLGGALMLALRDLTHNQVEFQGVGGEMMQQSGLSSLFPMSELSVMGLFEIIPAIPKLIRRINQTSQAAINFEPDIFITIDSPDFSLRVGKKVRAQIANQFSVHYVAPSVWAWRPERAEKMAKTVDHVLALLPFEPPYMEKAGMTCDFVGHPAANEPNPTENEIETVLNDLGVATSDETICILPGSRKGEIKRLMPIYLDALKKIHQKRPSVQFILPAARPVVGLLTDILGQSNLPIRLLDPTGFDPDIAEMRKRTVYASAKLAIATSGTIALDLAKQRCPMIIAYRASMLTERAVKRLAQIDRANLINITTDSHTIPELLFDKCTPKAVADTVVDMLDNPKLLKLQISACDTAMKKLGEGHVAPQLRAAQSVINAFEQQS